MVAAIAKPRQLPTPTSREAFGTEKGSGGAFPAVEREKFLWRPYRERFRTPTSGESVPVHRGPLERDNHSGISVAAFGFYA